MQDLKEFITVQIDSPIKCQVNIDGKNQFADIDTIYLKAFNVKEHKNITLPLRNLYKRMNLGNLSLLEKILTEDSDKNRVSKDESVKSEEQLDKELKESILQGFTITNPDELMVFYDKFKEFLYLNIAFKDQSFSSKINAVDAENLDNDDLESIISSYIASFFFQSWTR